VLKPNSRQRLKAVSRLRRRVETRFPNFPTDAAMNFYQKREQNSRFLDWAE